MEPWFTIQVGKSLATLLSGSKPTITHADGTVVCSDTANLSQALAKLCDYHNSLVFKQDDNPANADSWPGWQHDQNLAAIYAPQIADAFTSGMAAAEAFFAQLISGEVRVTPTYAAQEVSRLLAASLRNVMQSLWTEGYALGAISARHAVTVMAEAPASTASAAAILKLAGDPYPLPVTTPDWSGWQPGDLDAAAKVVSGDRLTQLLRQWGINVIQSVSQTKLGDLAQLIASALVDGKSSGQLAQEITGLLSIPSRAGMIAQTEVSRASSAATLDTYLDQGVSTKVWLVSPDERVCPVCLAAEAEGAIPLTQAFDSGVDAPPAHPRCRCTTLPGSVGDFDLSDMTVEPLPGFNLVPFGQPAVVKVGKKGYIHGWVFIGIPAEGDAVAHESLGHGMITSHDDAKVTAKFDDGTTHAFKRVAPRPSAIRRWQAAKTSQLREYLKRDIGDQDRADIQAVIDSRTPRQTPAAASLRSDLAALKPASHGRFSMNAHYQALDEVGKTPDGRALLGILGTFQNQGGSLVARIRTDVEKAVTGAPLPAGRKKAVDLLLGAVRDSDASDFHLYRGMLVPGADDIYKPGGKISISLGSFTSSPTVARSFGHTSGGKHVTAKRVVPVMLDWQDGPKKALPIERLADNPRFFGEHEFITTGDFEITGTRTAGDGTLVVKVRQVKPL
jgi:SPP1 gp7 family putative phage head morphogenesis protein